VARLLRAVGGEKHSGKRWRHDYRELAAHPVGCLTRYSSPRIFYQPGRLVWNAQTEIAMKLVDVDNALKVDRPELGTNVPVALFRLVRLVAFEEILGRGAAGPAYVAGKRLGKALGLPDVSAFLKLCEDLNIGKIKVPKQDETSLYVDVYECVTCAGLSPVGRKLCSFEGGLIAGVMESILKKPVTATEITCIGGLGHKTCGFDVQIGATSNTKLRAV
jgi:uncharacterized protein